MDARAAEWAQRGPQTVRSLADASVVEIVLDTRTADQLAVVLPAVVYAKILNEHVSVADLALIERTLRQPDERRPDPRPGRERFFRRERGLNVLAVVDFCEVPAIIVTVFAASHPWS